MSAKFIFVTGGVVSGLGKGITAASLGRLLKNRGYRVTIQKFDPYINVDPGTMSPYEHGEVFVTEDGAETDLDLGHYERFIDEELTKNSSITSGKIYSNVLTKERRGDYLGKTVQVIPHVTNEIKNQIYNVDNGEVDIIITEVGGTVGDIESLPFLEAIRQVGIEKAPEDVIYIHVTLLPLVPGSEELKSKPTQHSVKELQSLGIKPDILVCRADQEIEEGMKNKIALFCNVKPKDVISNLTVDNLYEVPLKLEEEGLANAACEHLKLKNVVPDHTEWEKMIKRIKEIKDTVKIAIVGKYVKLHDAYLSVAESLKHGGYANQVEVEISYIDSETITEKNAKSILGIYDGIVVPGGFGNRGIQGKIEAIRYARENDIPFLGICLGMQMAVIEFARDVLHLKNANSTEFDEITENPVIHIMENQRNVTKKGGTMRLGNYPCRIKRNSKAYQIYNQDEIVERHRHRFEFNNDYREVIEKKGLICSGVSPDNELVEMVEIKEHPYFVACQFHPEFKSRPNRPAPLFRELVRAAKEKNSETNLSEM